MLSPDLHDEFGVPYLNRLSDAFGGVYVHSCGDSTHLFASLEKVRDLRGLEFGASEAPYEKVLPRFGGRTVLACRVGLHRDIRFDGMADFVRQRPRRRADAARPLPPRRYHQRACPAGWPETDLDGYPRAPRRGESGLGELLDRGTRDDMSPTERGGAGRERA